VVNSIDGNKTYLGFPAEDAAVKRREYVWIRRIPALWKKMMED
jgi:UDP-3-O-[3-hydroxymyristoyl] glucosamine N-acyltransferase